MSIYRIIENKQLVCSILRLLIVVVLTKLKLSI